MAELKAEMAANVWKVLVEEGTLVDADQELVILESMKMEIPVVAPTRGVVSELRVREGDQVSEGDVLLRVDDR
jgi:acetyl-CoA carboxylase biotin carboxyl carrier protein